jgi:hypothetical protein
MKKRSDLRETALLGMSALFLRTALGLLWNANTTRLLVGALNGAGAVALLLVWGRRTTGSEGRVRRSGVWAAVVGGVIGITRVVAPAATATCPAPQPAVVAAIQEETPGADLRRVNMSAVHDNGVRELVYVAAVVDAKQPVAVWTVDTGLGNLVHALDGPALTLTTHLTPAPATYKDTVGAERARRCARKRSTSS